MKYAGASVSPIRGQNNPQGVSIITDETMNCGMDTWLVNIGMGATVNVSQHGHVQVKASTKERALLLHLGKKVHSKIQDSGSSPIITFSKRAVTLRVGKSIMYQKSRQQLLDLKDGFRSVEQLDREVIHLENRGSGANI